MATTLGLVVLPAPQRAVADVDITVRTADVPVHGGITLRATVHEPVGGAPAGGWPVVIVPGTFAGEGVNADLMAAALAKRGYVTVSYIERGLGPSGGEIDSGGPADVRDASDVLTWTLGATRADAGRVGIASISYGAGFIPMVIVRDPRFRAAAMVSGWGDMWRSRFPNDTPATASNLALLSIGATEGRLGVESSAFMFGVAMGLDTPDMRRYAAVRSPVTYLEQLQGRAVPLYVSTSMNEMIWPADQTMDFYEAYPGVKHLDVMPGDHATTELLMDEGNVGFTWDGAFDWMDRHLGPGGPAGQEPLPVRVAPRGLDILRSGLLRNYPTEDSLSIAAATAPARRWYLRTDGEFFGLVTNRTLSTSAGGGASRLREGENLLMTNGFPMYQGIAEVIVGTPTTIALGLVDPAVTGVWKGQPAPGVRRLRGAPLVHLELVPTAREGSVFAYLLEMAPDGTTRMIGHAPWSWRGRVPGRPLTVDVRIPYQAYDVPAGHRLVVAVSTGDVMYSDRNPAGSHVIVGAGSYVDLPLWEGSR